ncbi:MAG: hypothetical protein U0559_20055 [Anaerolineae bacterium]
MEWNIILHAADGYVEIVSSGVADRDGSLGMALALTQTMRAHQITRALIDHRQIERVVGSTLDVYDRPKAMQNIGAIFKIKIAEIIQPEHSEHFKFFETVCVNQGYQFAVFQDRDEALAWLLA